MSRARRAWAWIQAHPLAADSALAAALLGTALVSSDVTVVGVVIGAVALEPQLLSAIPEVGRFGPLFAAPQGIIGSEGMEGLLAPGAAIAVALAWVAATFAAAGARLRRGDLV